MFTGTGDRAGRGQFIPAIALLKEIVTSGTMPSVTFQSEFIPNNTFRDLILKVRGRGTAAATEVNIDLQFNGDGGTNYNSETLAMFSTGSPTCGQSIGATSMVLTTIPAASAVGNAAGNALITIFDYRGVAFNKTCNVLGGETKANSASNIIGWAGYGEWRSLAAITQIKVLLSSGSFVDGSVITLYGSY
jgi:hypothetical protein